MSETKQSAFVEWRLLKGYGFDYWNSLHLLEKQGLIAEYLSEKGMAILYYKQLDKFFLGSIGMEPGNA